MRMKLKGPMRGDGDKTNLNEVRRANEIEASNENEVERVNESVASNENEVERGF